MICKVKSSGQYSWRPTPSKYLISYLLPLLSFSPSLLPSHEMSIFSHPINNSSLGLLAYLDIHLHNIHNHLSSTSAKALIQTKKEQSLQDTL